MNEAMKEIEQLYNENYNMMFSFALAILANPEQAEDAVHNAFVEALKKYDDCVKDHPNKKGWLMQTLKRKTQEQQRVNRRQQQRTVDLEDQNNLGVSNNLDMDTQIIQKDFFRNAIREELSPEEYRLLTRYTIDGVGYTALSQEFGISPATCAKRIERIRKKLRKKNPQIFGC